jgi:hypothetical protein
MKLSTLIIYLLSPLPCTAQNILLLDGLNTNYYDVPRTAPTELTIQRSLFTSSAGSGYILEAGDDSYIPNTNNNLDGAKIIGNKFIWTAYDMYPSSILHGLMVGYNINYTIQHNYFDRLRYTSVFKGGIEEPMQWTKGGHSYNIHKNTKALTIKGITGVKILNNTFYSSSFSPLYHISIEENTGGEPDLPAENTTIQNNIFYQKDIFPAIRIRQASCLKGLVCDYNVYFCEKSDGNEPTFRIDEIDYSWTEWRAIGFDSHSLILDPMFIDTENFVPKNRLNYGIALGEEFLTGLATNAMWEIGKYPATTKQNEKWQIGAVLYAADTLIPYPVDSISQNADFVRIYPNPNNGYFQVIISAPLIENNHDIRIISSDGKVVYTTTILKGNSSTNFKLTNLKAGYYLLWGVNSGFSKKLIINSQLTQ